MSMYTRVDPFIDRTQAGKLLAEALNEYRNTDCIVIAIPRGGVVVAYEAAMELNAPLDVIVPRKIGAPGQPELAVGAVASWGDHQRIIDKDTTRMLGVSEEYISQEVNRQVSEINRRLETYRGTTEPPYVEGRTVILIDDGIATGYTTRAAILALRHLDAERIILAVPVGPPDTIQALQHDVDKVICLKTPVPFMAVGYWYRNFDQTTDDEVIDLLTKARERNIE